LSTLDTNQRLSAKNARIALVAMVALAFGLRFWFASKSAGESVWDGHYYDYYAKRIASGFGYTDSLGPDAAGRPSCHYPVGYSAALSAFYTIFGTARWVGHLFNALVGSSLVPLVYHLAARWLGRPRGLAAAFLVTVHPGLVVYSALTMSEPLAAALTLLAFALTGVTELNPRRVLVWYLLGCVVLGLAALVRPPALFCLPLLLSPELVAASKQAFPLSTFQRVKLPSARSKTLLQATLCLALGAAFTLLPVLPWTLRNCAKMDSCALVSTNGGWNLAIGAFPRATGRFETLRSSDGCKDVTGQVQQDRCWMQYGLRQIRENPAHWLRLAPKKWAYTFDHESFPVEYLHEARPELWPDARRNPMRERITDAHRALMALAALGVIRRTRAALWKDASFWTLCAGVGMLTYWGLQKPEPTVWALGLAALLIPIVQSAWLALERKTTLSLEPQLGSSGARVAGALLLTVYVTHALFFGEDRYHMVASPVLCMMAAGLLRFRRSDPSPGAADAY
jgi:Dolichyl-phosphate-mannose-protein mannosyltransferase